MKHYPGARFHVHSKLDMAFTKLRSLDYFWLSLTIFLVIQKYRLAEISYLATAVCTLKIGIFYQNKANWSMHMPKLGKCLVVSSTFHFLKNVCFDP